MRQPAIAPRIGKPALTASRRVFCASVSERHFVSTEHFIFEGKQQASGATLIPVSGSPSLKSEDVQGSAERDSNPEDGLESKTGCKGS